MDRSHTGQTVRHHPLSVDAVTSPTSATSASLSDILVTKRSSWPRIIHHQSTGADVAAAGWSTPTRGASRHGRAPRSSRRARSSSPYVGRDGVDDGRTRATAAAAADLDDTTPTSPVDGATVVRCLDSCDKILLRHSTTITWPHVTDDVVSCHFRFDAESTPIVHHSRRPTAKWEDAGRTLVMGGWRVFDVRYYATSQCRDRSWAALNGDTGEHVYRSVVVANGPADRQVHNSCLTSVSATDIDWT